ncbi:MAG: M56 family metallopeptidase [Candidatus Bathyarchaeota archaeon]|nr:M56 family metallopeptidase [Candidatus Bathyarchaeota archaeon]
MVEPTIYHVKTDVPASYVEKLFDFIHSQYLLSQKERFTNFNRQTTNQQDYLAYTVTDNTGKMLMQVEAKSDDPIEIKVTPLESNVTQTMMEEAKQDIVIALQLFEEHARKATLYFAWREGEEIVPEAYTKPEKSFNRLFLETQILFFIVFIVFGTFIFIVLLTVSPEIFWIAPLVLIAVQFVFVFYSTAFIGRTADWKITAANPTIHLLELYLPSGDKSKYSKDQIRAIKKEIYDEIIATKGQNDIVEAQKIFCKHGIECKLENLKTKKINVYALVKKIADLFSFPTPKIVVSNTMVPNAAASGPSPKRGLVLITTGLLVKLEEDEVESVLGHEFGHLRGRDPLILYGLTAAEFLFRFYVLFPLFPIIFSTLLFFVYFWAIMVVIFFIAKFFEARADIVSANMVGQPSVLAGSLEKIGFQRLLYERTPSFRLQEWLGLDPHPPIYFRVDRLEKLGEKKIRHPLIRSIRDVISGFLASF